MLVLFSYSTLLISLVMSLISLMVLVCSKADVTGAFFLIKASSDLAVFNDSFSLLISYVSEKVVLPESSLILASLLNSL